MKLPAYPRYKPSGVEWLGDVPEHWAVKRLKYSATINDEGKFGDVLGMLLRARCW